MESKGKLKELADLTVPWRWYAQTVSELRRREGPRTAFPLLSYR
jgi:hypothetical protein